MYLQNTEHVIDNHKTYKFINNTRKKEYKEFPPPLPLPCVLKRYYTSEGRLILKEKKVKQHEYFRAHRANGRLTLHLVNVSFDDYEDYCEETTPTCPYQELGTNNVTHDHTRVVNTSDDKFDDVEEAKVNSNNTVADGFSQEHESDVVLANGNGRVKRLNCSSVRSSPTCNNFGLPVYPIRIVQVD